MGKQCKNKTNMLPPLASEIEKLRSELLKLQQHLAKVELKYQEKLAVCSEGGDSEFMRRHMKGISDLFDNHSFSDLLIIMEGGKNMAAHKFVMLAQSDYWKESGLGTVDMLDLSDMKYEVVYAMMKWLYTGEIDIEEVVWLRELSKVAADFKLSALCNRCQVAGEFIEIKQEQELLLDDVEEMGNNCSSSDIESRPEDSKEGFCNECGRMFNNIESLQKHERLHFTTKKYKCEMCPKSYKKPFLLRKHLKSHEGIKDFKCDLCEKLFTTRGNLNAHMKRHAGVSKWDCKLCKRMFNSNGNLEIHMRTHNGIKPFKCKYCDLTFSQHGNQKSHMRIHTGEKPYDCKDCSKAFSSQSRLTRHEVTHSHLKPHKCEYCDKGFTQKQHLNKHIYSHADEVLNINT